jgi:hypothetical protein
VKKGDIIIASKNLEHDMRDEGCGVAVLAKKGDRLIVLEVLDQNNIRVQNEKFASQSNFTFFVAGDEVKSIGAHD